MPQSKRPAWDSEENDRLVTVTAGTLSALLNGFRQGEAYRKGYAYTALAATEATQALNEEPDGMVTVRMTVAGAAAVAKVAERLQAGGPIGKPTNLTLLNLLVDVEDAVTGHGHAEGGKTMIWLDDEWIARLAKITDAARTYIDGV